MATRSELEARIRRLLEDAPLQTTLAEALDSSETGVDLSSTSDVTANSILEAGEEQMLARSVTDPTVTVVRGYKGTTAASHSNGDTVRINPRYPKANIVEAINVVRNNWITTYMPRLEWDTSTAGKFVTNRWIYNAPTDAIGVEKVEWSRPGRTQNVPVPHGPLDVFPTEDVSNGVGFEVYEMGLEGRDVRALYRKPWTDLDSDSDTTESDFPAQADELVVTGAVLYLLGWRLVPKLRLDETVFAQERNAGAPTNANIQLVERMRRDWVETMLRATSERPGAQASPKKVLR